MTGIRFSRKSDRIEDRYIYCCVEYITIVYIYNDHSLGPSRHVNDFATAIASNPLTEDINRAISFSKTTNFIHITR